MSSPISAPPAVRPNQNGFSLLVSLTFLVILTLLGIGAMKVSSMQERMAGNALDRALAFQAADRTLREAEDVVSGASAYDFTPSCANGRCTAGSAPAFSDDTQWGGLNDVAATTVLGSAGDVNSKLAATPRWRAEFVAAPLNPKAGTEMPIYRMTARATGQNIDTRIFLQSVYQRN